MKVLYRKYKALARELSNYGVARTRYREGRAVDFRNTALLYYPPSILNAPPWYERVRTFASRHKLGQKRILSEYFDVPPDASECDPPYIVRPVRHFGGRHFYVARTREELRDIGIWLGDHYASGVFQRTREFRSFFVGGKHVVTMLKKVDEDVAQDDPWNHQQCGSRFLTVTKDVNNMLLRTRFFEDAERFFQDYPLDVAAVDTGYMGYRGDKENKYAVFEINLAPRISVESALEPVVEAIRSLR